VPFVGRDRSGRTLPTSKIASGPAVIRA